MPKETGIVFAGRLKNNAMKTRFKDHGSIVFLHTVVSDFFSDKILKMAASLAYSTLIAFPALLIIILWVSSMFYDSVDIRETITSHVASLVGKGVAKEVDEVMNNSRFDYTSIWAKALGIAALLLGATGIFSEIQDSINTIWGLKTKPRAGFLKIFINRLLSFSIIISLGFILVVSLVANALMTTFIDKVQARFPDIPILFYYIVNQLLMCGVLILLFGAIFKILPDAKISWRDVLFSAVATTVLFMIGKFMIEYILSHNATVSLYGSAGSVIILMLWVYYSSVILYLGAEITQAWVKTRGRRIHPNRYAVWVETKAVAVPSNTEVSKVQEPVKEKTEVSPIKK